VALVEGQLEVILIEVQIRYVRCIDASLRGFLIGFQSGSLALRKCVEEREREREREDKRKEKRKKGEDRRERRTSEFQLAELYDIVVTLSSEEKQQVLLLYAAIVLLNLPGVHLGVPEAAGRSQRLCCVRVCVYVFGCLVGLCSLNWIQ